MAWIVPLSRSKHPCILPDDTEKGQHRVGEYFRCEVCDDLWRLSHGPLGRLFTRATNWDRWKMRGQGYNNDPVS